MKIKFDKEEFESSFPRTKPIYNAVNYEVEISDKLVKIAIIIIDELEDRARDELQNIWDDQIEFPLVPFPFFSKYREPENIGVGDYWINHWLFASLSDNISDRSECIEILEQLGGLDIIKNPVINLLTGNFKGDYFVVSIDPPVLDYLKIKLVKEEERIKVELGEELNSIPNIAAKFPSNQPNALELCIRRGSLCISGVLVKSILKSDEIVLRKLRGGNSTILLEQTIRVCKISPTTFRKITKNELENKSGVGIDALKEAMGEVDTFMRYISNVGLKRKLGDLFYATSSSNMGYQFRLAVTLEEWRNLDKSYKKDVLEDLVNIQK